MKRDFELVRKLLMFFEEQRSAKHVEMPPIEGYDEGTIKYHLVLLHEAGLLQCEPIRSTTSDRVIYVIPFDLTWDGHEFLDKVRNDNVLDENPRRDHVKGWVACIQCRKSAGNSLRAGDGATKHKVAEPSPCSSECRIFFTEARGGDSLALRKQTTQPPFLRSAVPSKDKPQTSMTGVCASRGLASMH